MAAALRICQTLCLFFSCIEAFTADRCTDSVDRLDAEAAKGIGARAAGWAGKHPWTLRSQSSHREQCLAVNVPVLVHLPVIARDRSYDTHDAAATATDKHQQLAAEV